MIAEYTNSGALLRRYVHGSNVEADDPLIVYEGATVSNATRRYLHADPRGSIVAVTDHQGNTLSTNAYDEYGIPDAATQAAGSTGDVATKGRFRYTGQAYIPELGMHYYKARIYSPTLGRFLQTDPIGYEDQFNLYAYVANDPVNAVDPTGLSDLNLFHYQDSLYFGAHRFDPKSRKGTTYTITGHAGPKGIFDHRVTKNWDEDYRINAVDLVAMAKADGYDNSMTLFLAACHLAAGDYARNVARAAKGTVIAADGFVFIPSTAKGYDPYENPETKKITLTVNHSIEGNGSAGNFVEYDKRGNVVATFDSATYNPETGRVTFNGAAVTGTRIPRSKTLCLDGGKCGK